MPVPLPQTFGVDEQQQPTCEEQRLVLLSKGQQGHLQGTWGFLQGCNIDANILELPLLCSGGCTHIDLSRQRDASHLEVDLVPVCQLFAALAAGCVICKAHDVRRKSCSMSLGVR